MKKIVFVLVCLMMFASLVQAQDKKSNKGWKVYLGPVVNVPLKFLGMFHSFGIGADLAALHPIDNGFSAGGRVNHSYYFGTSAPAGLTGNNKSHYDATNLTNVLGEANYEFENHILASVDLGLGFASSGGFTNTSFARMIFAGYKLPNTKGIIISIYFDETNFEKNLALKGSFPL
jgi:hypothetical protein